MADFLIYTMDQARRDAPSHSITSNAASLHDVIFPLVPSRSSPRRFFVDAGKTRRISTQAHFASIILCKYRLILAFAMAKSPAISSEQNSRGRKGRMTERHVQSRVLLDVNASAWVRWHCTNAKLYIDISYKKPSKVKRSFIYIKYWQDFW